METLSVAEAKARFSAVLAAVEAGEEIVITRRGKAVARLVPERSESAARLFRAIGGDQTLDLEPPPDRRPEPVDGWK
jgi:prevent-host-death family protein